MSLNEYDYRYALAELGLNNLRKSLEEGELYFDGNLHYLDEEDKKNLKTFIKKQEELFLFQDEWKLKYEEEFTALLKETQEKMKRLQEISSPFISHSELDPIHGAVWSLEHLHYYDDYDHWQNSILC